MLSIPLDRHEMLADLLGREGDAGVALGQLLEEAGLFCAGRRHDVGAEGAQIVRGEIVWQREV